MTRLCGLFFFSCNSRNLYTRMLCVNLNIGITLHTPLLYLYSLELSKYPIMAALISNLNRYALCLLWILHKSLETPIKSPKVLERTLRKTIPCHMYTLFTWYTWIVDWKWPSGKLKKKQSPRIYKNSILMMEKLNYVRFPLWMFWLVHR